MAAITAEMVKNLRDKTGAGMMDCKKALEEAQGDVEKAVDGLRKSGIAKAEKKASRTTKEGLFFSSVQGQVAVLVELLCETDFVARNDKFREYGNQLAAKIARDYTQNGDVSAAVAEAEKTNLASLVGVIGENMQVRRVLRWQAADGQFAFYNHQNLSKCCVLIEAAGEVDATVIRDATMHVAAFSPRYVTPDQIPAEAVAREKDIAAAQVVDKPANIVDKIVAGKINKWYSDVCLMLQPWMRDDKTCLSKVAPKLVVRRFVRWQIGEAL